MRRIRFIWYGLVAVVFVLGFFGIWNAPKDWSSTMTAIAPLETWWTAHAAHPLLAAFGAGALLGTVLLPEVLLQLKPHIFPPVQKPDIAAGDAFKLLFSRSKIARHLVKNGMLTRAVISESHLTEPQKIAGRLRVELSDRIHNELATGKLLAWGRTDGPNPERMIAFTEWQDAEIDFSPRTLESSPTWVCAYKRGNDPRGRRIAFVGVRFCRAQLEREFPLRRLKLGRTKYVSFGKDFEEIAI